MTETIETSPAVQQEIERNFPWNFAVNVMDGATYWFGYSFISITIILPLYISHFTDNPLVIGLIPFINTAGFFLPQLLRRTCVDGRRARSGFRSTLAFLPSACPYYCLAPSAYFLAISQPVLALVTFFFVLHLVLRRRGLDHRRLAGYGRQDHPHGQARPLLWHHRILSATSRASWAGWQ